MHEDQITTQPANLGEVNLTLRFMQKTQTESALATKEALNEITKKLDLINSNTVPMSQFVSFVAHVEKDYATKEEIKPCIADSESVKILMQWRDTLIGKIWGISATVGAILGLIELVIHLYGTK